MRIKGFQRSCRVAIMVLYASLVAAGTAHATPPGGVLLGPATAPTRGPPLWVTDAGLVIARLVLPEPYASVPAGLACWDVSGTTAAQVGPTFAQDVNGDGALEDGEFLVASPDSEAVLIGFYTPNNKLRVIRAVCGDEPVFVGEVLLPEGAAAGAITPFSGRVPLAADGTFIIPHPGGIVRIDPTALTATIELSAADLREALKTSAGPGAAATPYTGSLTVTGLELAPAARGGRLWLSVFRNRTDLALPATDSFVLEVTSVGHVRVNQTLTTSHGPLRDLVWDDGLGAMLLAPAVLPLGPGKRVVVLPVVSLEALGAPHEPDVLAPAWPYAGALPSQVTGLIGGADGQARLVYGCSALYDQSNCQIATIAIDPESADFDRDGLGQANEIQMGLDDRRADTDGDGASDAVELYFRTDPRDPASPGPVVPVATVLAPSSFPGDSGALTGRDIAKQVAAVCGGEPVTCLGPDGQARGGAFPVVPSFTPDGEVAFYIANPLEEWQIPTKIGLVSQRGSDTPVVAVDEVAASDWMLEDFSAGSITVLAEDLFFHRGPRGLTRFKGGLPEVVIGLHLANGVDGFRVVGIDAEHEAVLVYQNAGPVRQLLAIGRDKTDVVLDVTALPGALEPQQVIAIPRGGVAGAPTIGWIVTLEHNDPAPPFNHYLGSAVFDRYFRVVNPLQPPIIGELGAWFTNGPLQVRAESFMHLPGGGSCMDGRYDFCGDGGASSPTPIIYPAADPTEWLPTPVGLSAGDVLLFSRQGGYRVGFGWIGQDGQARSGDFDLGTGNWLLHRVAEGGGRLPWLDSVMFTQLADATGGVSLAALPVGPITHLGIRDDLRRVCLVEGGQARAWEVSVDGMGLPEAVRLVRATATEACGYDTFGNLGLLGGTPTRLDVGSDSYPAGDVGASAELVHTGEYWIYGGRGAEARCISDTGSASLTGLTMVALARLGDDGIVWVDEAQQALAGLASEVCAGAGPRERLTATGIWSLGLGIIWNASDFGAASEVRGSLAVRGDGMVLFATEGNFSSLLRDLVYRLHPRWEPLDWNRRIAWLDPYRREVARVAVQSLDVQAVTTMAAARGGSATPKTWEYFATAAPDPVVAPPDPDVSEPSVAEPVPPTKPRDEGCAGGGNSLVWAGLFALSLLSRGAGRRRESGPDAK